VSVGQKEPPVVTGESGPVGGELRSYLGSETEPKERKVPPWRGEAGGKVLVQSPKWRKFPLRKSP